MAETSKTDGGRLTTHVLDTATGRPAAGLSIALYRLEGLARTLLKTVVTNADGRCDAPLLAGADFRTGEYELVFAAGDYLRGQGTKLPEPAFLDSVPIRFGMAQALHYHVPLLISPYGYSTYRGS
ncbi:hydroxyisourate hydrolase [Mesorhizobium australicum]|jgi:5-hydroxyisourate hydrolase|uniref:Hydroxyisourate hydrolase n=1 Tax=Mesorhizobium australicum TaxID=536018 RepID=A0ACC6T6R5_9HYPH|nr:MULTISPECIES: hydroxyisourate hydrolase [unclassified Mesorhizobium]ESY93572.1 5-hydroxyisourate hydrolase [Mesorhizobium sp. LNHC229A00]ESZ00487.1 5-hydroxyisourate hydrolase [Mesorhizobium sp. LNHC209A00]